MNIRDLDYERPEKRIAAAVPRCYGSAASALS